MTAVTLADNVQDVNAKSIEMGNAITDIDNDVQVLSANSEQMGKANSTATKSMETVLDSSINRRKLSVGLRIRLKRQTRRFCQSMRQST